MPDYQKYIIFVAIMEDLRCANSTLMTSYDDGMQKGLQKGRAEAEAKAHEEKLASALAIYKSGSMPLEQIAAIMKLDAGELAEYVGR